jgi:CheY-like chemotaxis protein
MNATLAGRFVLVVEDEYFVADEMRRAFEKAGAKVLGPVAQVEHALRLIAAADRIDAAVLDIRLFDGDVYPVADALQARGVPFVFATGYERSAIPERYANVRVLQKPVAPETVITGIFG